MALAFAATIMLLEAASERNSTPKCTSNQSIQVDRVPGIIQDDCGVQATNSPPIKASPAAPSLQTQDNHETTNLDKASEHKVKARSEYSLSGHSDEAVVAQTNTKPTKRSLSLPEASNATNTKKQRFGDILRPYEFYEELSASDCEGQCHANGDCENLMHQDESGVPSTDFKTAPQQNKKVPVQAFDLAPDYVPSGALGNEDEFDDKELDSILSHSLSINPTFEPTLCKEQADLVETIMSGRNVFYTGSAGCGKSTVLNHFVKRLKFWGKRVSIVAPTARAALNVNGSTVHSYAGWTPNTMRRDMKNLLAACHQERIWKRLNKTDVLVIDEISMMENFRFERLSRIMKEARKRKHQNSWKAFGGVQVIVAGDFLQLPPVQPLQFCLECGQRLEPVDNHRKNCSVHGDYHMSDQWAFMSDAWRECDFVHINLTTIHRQKDLRFVQLLEKLRLGKLLDYEDRDLLLNHDSNTDGAVKLFSLRKDVTRLNEREFALLQGPITTYTCDDDFRVSPEHQELVPSTTRDPVDGSWIVLEHRLERRINMKVGMRVMLLYNLNIQEGLGNGSQGTVTGFQRLPTNLKEVLETKGEHAQHRSSLIERYIHKNEGKEWPVVQFDDNRERTIYPVCMVNELGDEAPWSLISRTQIPLVASWAMTIHKAQGMTIPRVIVDLAKTFEKGHDYVALSRATGLEGLRVERLGSLDREMDPQVRAFLEDKFGLD